MRHIRFCLERVGDRSLDRRQAPHGARAAAFIALGGPASWAGADWAAWLPVSGGPVGPPAMWAATSYVEGEIMKRRGPGPLAWERWLYSD